MIGEIIAILAVLTFVVSNVIFRKTEHETSPTFINFFRTATGTLTFIIISLFMGVFQNIFILPWDIWIFLFLSFLFGQVIGDTSYFNAQKELGTTIALAVSMTFPVFTFILSLIFLNRPFEIKMLISLFLISSGIIIIGKNKMTHNISKNSINSEKKKTNVLKSLSYGLVASLGWAVGLVIIDYSVNRIDDILNTNGVSTIIGNVIRFPFALSILGSMVIRENITSSKINKIKLKKSSRTYLLLTLGAFIGTSLGAFLYTEAARVAGANVMSLIATAAPLFALPLTYWINKETISKIGFIGVVLTILGVVIILT